MANHKPDRIPENQRLFQLEGKSRYHSTIYLVQAIFEFVHSSLALSFCVEACHVSTSGILLINARSQSKRRGKARREEKRREENFARSKVVLEAMGYASSSREQ
jgi:hypothetical protein